MKNVLLPVLLLLLTVASNAAFSQEIYMKCLITTDGRSTEQVLGWIDGQLMNWRDDGSWALQPGAENTIGDDFITSRWWVSPNEWHVEIRLDRITGEFQRTETMFDEHGKRFSESASRGQCEKTEQPVKPQSNAKARKF